MYYSNAYILVQETVTVPNTKPAGAAEKVLIKK